MLPIESVAQQTEKYVKQLESLAHTKNAALAAKLSGAIEASIMIMQVNSDAWNARVDAAMTKIMADPPKAPEMTDKGLPAQIKAATLSPTVSGSKMPPAAGSAEAGLPQIDVK